MLLKIPSKDTATVVGALTKHVRKLPQQLRQLLDLGPRQGDGRPQEFSPSLPTCRFISAIHTAPGGAGSNENTNGLLRQYFPRGTDLSCFSQDYLNRYRAAAQSTPPQDLGVRNPLPIDYKAVLH